MYTDFNHFFVVRTRNLSRIKVRLHQPPHLYFVTALPSKTHTTSNINIYMFDLLILTAHKKSYVTVKLTKRRYSNEIAVFDMSTVILYNTCKTTTALVEATVNETL